MRFVPVVRLLVAIAACVLSTSCATLLKGGHQRVSFDSNPAGASVVINGQWEGSTPVQSRLKTNDSYTIEFRKEGYRTESVRLRRVLGVGWVIADVFFGVWPAVVDGITGDWYSLDRSRVRVELQREDRERDRSMTLDVPAPMPASGDARSVRVSAMRKTAVAVADLTGKEVSQAHASIVSDFLRSELVRTGAFTVVERANMDKILAEAGFQMSGCTEAECAVQMGKLLNVTRMVVGSVSKLIDTYYVTVNLVDVETGGILNALSQKASTTDELQAACRAVAAYLAR